jgi:FkbM family methyltransferase
VSRAAGRARAAWRAFEQARLERRLAGPRLLAAFAEAHPQAFFVEIGSNDGEQHDHVRPFVLSRPWRGIMVEPVPYIFERLRANYRDVADRVALENLAIADRDGTLPFFHLVAPDPADLPDLPDWYDGVGSFSREAVARHVTHIPDVERRIVEARVECLTFDSLLRRHGEPVVDLLVTDTEGYDFALLESIDLERHRPRMVVYEHFHLSPDDRAACRARLERAGYRTLEEGFDTWCVRSGAGDALDDAMRRAKPAVRGLSAAEDEDAVDA